MLCRLEQRTGGQVIPTATKTVIQFDKVVFNSLNSQIGVTAPWSVIPVNFAGTYMVTASVSLDTGTTGVRFLYIEAYDNYTGWVTVGSTQLLTSVALSGYKVLNCVAMVSLLPFITTFNIPAQREQVRMSVYHTQGANITVAAPNYTDFTPVTSLSLTPAYPS
jgi:hypothetical protein